MNASRRQSRARKKRLIVAMTGAITGTLQNARFVFDDVTGKLSVIQPSRAGRALDIDATRDAIQAAALSDSNRTVVAAVTTLQPPVPDTASGPELGITHPGWRQNRG
mgnify:CR=1 FL=1